MIELINHLTNIPWELFGGFFLSIIILIFLSEYSYKNDILDPNLNRKIIHFMVGVAVSFSPFIFLSNIQPLILAVTFLIINLFSYKHNKLKSFHNLNRKTLGTTFFPLGFIIIASLFWEHKYSIACSFMILAVSDPLSSLAGENIKKPHKYNIWNDLKSYEGSGIMFLSTFIILMLFSKFIFYQFDTDNYIIEKDSLNQINIKKSLNTLDEDTDREKSIIIDATSNEKRLKEEKNELIEIDTKYFETEKSSNEDLDFSKKKLQDEINRVKEFIRLKIGD